MSTDVMTQVADDNFEALVSKGIHAILFPLKRGTNGAIELDKSKNLLHGYPIGGFDSTGDTVESEEFQDQLMGGNFKNFIGGAIDAGEITFNAYFAPTKGKPKIEGVVNSMVIVPQFVLSLARKKNETTLEGFFTAGVNYGGGNDIKGELGKALKTSLKFKITGEPKVGYDEVGEIPMSDYTAGSTS
ncbi:MAG: hypothetical protein FWE95_07810 [Planctomycetaceae bacterium]|nr:hypothetical protein [Planctomycetaceae bacterium]